MGLANIFTVNAGHVVADYRGIEAHYDSRLMHAVESEAAAG